jgi:hypothetical protein
MGIDISAYKDIIKVSTGHFDADGDPINKETGEAVEYDFRAYANPDFPGREEGVEDRAHYTAGSYGNGFSAGYGRYNRLREELAKLGGWPVGEYVQYGVKHPTHCEKCWAGEKGPFSELINFSDCEGTIGPVVSKKLAADFAEHQGKADAHPSEEFRAFYAAMRNAFETGAQNGCVVFH